MTNQIPRLDLPERIDHGQILRSLHLEEGIISFINFLALRRIWDTKRVLVVTSLEVLQISFWPAALPDIYLIVSRPYNHKHYCTDIPNFMGARYRKHY